VVSADGEQLGVLPIAQALELARQGEMDLVEVAAEALGMTLRALLRRPAAQPTAMGLPPPADAPGRVARGAAAPARGEPFAETLLAVARANGRVATAARSLGVHRNTVLYRLRVVRAQRGIDPRRPEDALRLLREDDRSA